MGKNYYDILGVNKNATQDEIKKAYRDLCKKYHPDRNGGDDTKFKEVNEAYSVLGDANEKQKYDSQGTGFNPFGNFHGFGNTHFHFGNMASDVRMTFSITLEEAYYGCTRSINANGKIFSVDIPKGTTNGKTLKIPGLGQSGINIHGQEAVGDLIVTVLIPNNNNKMWLNDNGLLEIMCVVDWIDAILGTEMTTKVFDRDVKFRVPKYTQNGGYTIVGGQGFHKFKSDELGSLKVNFIIKMPKSLTDSQVSHLKKIKESL